MVMTASLWHIPLSRILIQMRSKTQAKEETNNVSTGSREAKTRFGTSPLFLPGGFLDSVTDCYVTNYRLDRFGKCDQLTGGLAGLSGG